MTVTTSDVRNNNAIFKNNSTYLSQGNWQVYFGTTLPDGFIDHCITYWNNQLQLQQKHAFINGMMVSPSSYASINLADVTAEEFDCLYYMNYGKIMKATNIAQNDDGAFTFLSLMLYALSLNEATNISYTISQAIYGHEEPELIPLAYGIYGHGWYDLSKIITKNDCQYPVNRIIYDSSTPADNVVTDPYPGLNSQYGLCNIYGGHLYNFTIDAHYSQNDYLLYPVPSLNMGNTTIYIKNENASQINIKLPLSYNGMYFDYVRDGTWNESGNWITYILPAESDIYINLQQSKQSRTEFIVSNVTHPQSVFLLTQNLKNDDPGEGYTKAEANALFATLTDLEEGLAEKIDGSSLGALATQDTVDYDTEVTNKPDLGSMADVDDATSDDNTYGRKNGSWAKVVSQADLDSALLNKADSIAIADEYDQTQFNTYTVGDVVMRYGKLYLDTEDWTVLTVQEIAKNGSTTRGSYLTDTNHFSLYIAVENVSWNTSSAEAAIENLLESNKIAPVTVATYGPFSTYTAGSITRLPNGDFVELNGTYGKFSPVSVEDLLEGKADASALNGKAPLASPALTGTPTAPTAAKATDSTQIATTAFVHDVADDYAPIASPAFTGTPTAPTPSSDDNSTKLATTAYVQAVLPNVPDVSGLAPKASPAFTGTPTAPTAAKATDNTQIATTEFVHDVVDDYAPRTSPSFFGTPTAPTPSANDDSMKLATTAFVQDAIDAKIASKAPLASPSFTGNPTAPTQTTSDSSTKLATTAFVKNVLASMSEAASMTYYVDAATGSDSNDGTTAQTAFQTIERAIEVCPRGVPCKIMIVPGSYGGSGVTISGKYITIQGTSDGTVQIRNTSGSVISPALTVTEGSIVELVGNFLMYSSSDDPLLVEKDAALIHKKLYTNDKLTCTIYQSSTTTTYYGVRVEHFGRLEMTEPLQVNFSNASSSPTTASVGLYVGDGGFVKVGSLIFEGFARQVIKCDAGVLIYQSITGAPVSYSDPIIANGGIVLDGDDGIYTAAQIDTLLGAKANASDLSAKANLASPTFTGTPKAPTAGNSTNSTQIATTAFVQNLLQSLGLNASATIFVDGTNGNDSTGDGSQAAPFKTIQKAVDTAFAPVPTTILAVPGVYNESVTINGQNIIMQGTTNTEVRIVGQSINPAITVNNGGKLALYGHFYLKGNTIGLSVRNNSYATYAALSNGDTLDVYTVSTAAGSNAINVSKGSQFSAQGNVYVDVPTTSYTSNAVSVQYGGQVSIYRLSVSMSTLTDVAVYNECSVAIIGGLSGSYKSSDDSYGFTKIAI